MENFLGVGLYTPSEASKLVQVPAQRIARWLRGHRVAGREYKPLWSPSIVMGDGLVCLNFRDLMEVRVADKLIACGVSAQRVRAAIILARQVIKKDWPLSSDQFRTDGRNIILRVVETDEHGERREHFLNLFRRQYEFKQIIEPLLKTVDFDEQGAPCRWWPLGKAANVIVDPERSFGQPIDAETSVPTTILANAGRTQGVGPAAIAFDVPVTSIRRAMKFEDAMEKKAAA